MEPRIFAGFDESDLSEELDWSEVEVLAITEAPHKVLELDFDEDTPVRFPSAYLLRGLGEG